MSTRRWPIPRTRPRRSSPPSTAGKSLEDAAKEVLGSADGVIKLGPVTKKELPPGPLADGIFALPEGVAPAPIQSPLGWHIVRINKIEPGKSVPFDEVKEKLEKDMQGAAGARPSDQAGHRFRAHAGQDPVDEGRRRGSRPQGQDLRERRRARHGCRGQAGRHRPGRRRTGPGSLRHARKRRKRAAGNPARRVLHRAHRPRHPCPRSRPHRGRTQGRRGMAGRGTAQARRRQGEGRGREGQCRHRSRHHRQGARPGSPDRQGR